MDRLCGEKNARLIVIREGCCLLYYKSEIAIFKQVVFGIIRQIFELIRGFKLINPLENFFIQKLALKKSYASNTKKYI